MSLLNKLTKKYGSLHNNDGEKENHDPMSSDHPENSNEYINIQCNEYTQNGKQNKSKTQNTKTKDEWDSNKHLLTQHSSNNLTLSINDTTLINQSFDELQLKKKKKQMEHSTYQKTTNQNQFDIWLIISSNNKPIIDINLYKTSNVSLISSDNTIIYLQTDFGNKTNLYVYDTDIQSKVTNLLNKSTDDIFISIMHDNSEGCTEFFKFIEYLHQKTPSDRDISKDYKTLIHKNTTTPKSNKNYARSSKLNARGYTPNVSSTKKGSINSSHSRAVAMATAGQQASNPAAAKAATDRYNKNKKPAAPNVVNSTYRHKIQLDHFRNKNEFKSPSYAKVGKSAGNFMSRKNRNRQVFKNRTAKAQSGNRNAQNRINNSINKNDMPFDIGRVTDSYLYSRLDSRYTVKRSGEQIGFKNLGNTCYINAILRSINSLNCLSNDFRRQYVFDISGNNIYGIHSVFRSYLELLFKDINNSEKKILDPWIFKKIIGKMDEMFASYSQQDAHELLSFLLNALHDQIFKGINNHFEKDNSNSNSNNSNNSNENSELKKEELEWLSPIHSNFHFEIEFEYECTKCGYKRNKIESFREMSLDLPLKKHEKKQVEKQGEKQEEKQDENKQQHEQKQDENNPENKQEHEQKQQEEQEDVIMKSSNSNSHKSEKEEMSEDEKEETKQEEVEKTPPEPTPFEKLKAKLLAQSEGACPIHKDKDLYFKGSAASSYLKMYCKSCNDAELGQILNPEHISVPPSQMPADSGPPYPLPMSYNYGGIRDTNGHEINEWTLNELLRAYFVKKTLEYKCEHNGCKNNKVYVTSWFKQIPRVLVFHIKRFIPNYYTNSYTKSHDKVKIEKKIDINMFCNEKLSLPPDIWEDYFENRHGEMNGEGKICNNGNDIYDIIRNDNQINVLDICKQVKDLPKEMQIALKKEDYKEKKDENKDEDDDIEILNNNNGKNKNIKQEKDEKCNGNVSSDIPPDVLGNGTKVSNVRNTMADININVDSKNDCETKMDNKNESEFHLPENELKLQQTQWDSIDPTWKVAWSKERCEHVLRNENSEANIIDYAKMYYKHWKSMEYYEKLNNGRKRKRSDDGSSDGTGEPRNKKQKCDSDGQQKITDMFDKQRRNNNNSNGYGNKEDYDAELQRVIAESLNSNSNNNSNNSNGCDDYKLQQVSKPKSEGVVGSMENSGNINKFVSVCDKELLPNDLDVTEYNLRCIVRHLGNNYSSGHYITDVLSVKGSDDDKDKEKGKDKEHKWKRHDDQYVSDITDTVATDDKAQQNAYIFFYVHQSAMKKYSVKKK